MRNGFQRFQRWITLVLLVVISFGFVLMTYYSTINYFQDSGSLAGSLGLLGGLLLLALLMWLLLYRITSQRMYLVALLGIAIGLRFIWIWFIRTPLASDYLLLHKAAVAVVEGRFVMSDSAYFSNWVYQIGYMLYEALIVRLFGTQLLWFKLLNVAWFSGTLLLLYLLVRQLVSERAARFAALLYAFYPPSIFLSSVLTNDYISTFFFYLGIYLLLCKKKPGWYFAGGLALALGNILRPLGSLVLLAVVLYLIFYALLFAGKQVKQTLLQIVLLLTSYFLLIAVFNFGIQATGVSDYPLGNRNQTWKFIIGLNRETVGGYSDADAEYLWQFPLGEKRDAAGRQVIKERTADKVELLQFFYEKYKVMWSQYDSSLSWALAGTRHTKLAGTLLVVQFAGYLLIVVLTGFGSLITLYRYFRKQGIDRRQLFFVVLIMGYMLAHLILEIQTRYRFFIIPAFLILAGACWPVIEQALDQKLPGIFPQEAGVEKELEKCNQLK